MTHKKYKLSIVALALTAIACFAVAIFGSLNFNTSKTYADSTAASYRVLIDNTSVDSYSKSVWLVNEQEPAESATKVYLEYTMEESLSGSVQSFAAMAFYGTGNWDHQWLTGGNSHVIGVNNPQVEVGTYLITFDLTADHITWNKGETVILEGDGNGTNALADALSYGFRFSTNVSNKTFTVKMYDDTGKDLGVKKHGNSSSNIALVPNSVGLINVDHVNTNANVGEGIATELKPAEGATKVTIVYTIDTTAGFVATFSAMAINNEGVTTSKQLHAGNLSAETYATFAPAAANVWHVVEFDLANDKVYIDGGDYGTITDLDTYCHFGFLYQNNSGSAETYKFYAFDNTGKDLGMVGTMGARWESDKALTVPDDPTYLTTFSNGDYQLMSGHIASWYCSDYVLFMDDSQVSETDGVLKFSKPVDNTYNNVAIKFGRPITATDLTREGSMVIRIKWQSDSNILRYMNMDGIHQVCTQVLEMFKLTDQSANSIDEFTDMVIPYETLLNMVDEEGEIKGIQFKIPGKDTATYEDLYFDYVRYLPNKYYVSFDSNGGSAVETITATKDQTIEAPVAPTKLNHSFVGWYTDAELTTAFDFSTAITEDITLYAKWAITEITTYNMIVDSSAPDGFTWHTKEAPAESATKVTIEFKTVDRANPGRHHQLFASDERSTLSGGQTFNDSWFPIGGTVTYVVDLATKYIELFDVNGNGLMDLTYTDDATQFGATIYHGYDGGYLYCTGLYEIKAYDDTGKDLGITTSATTGVTITTEEVVKVTINDGMGGTSSSYVNSGNAVAQPTISNPGYLLVGWYADSECTVAFNFTTAITEDTTIYAKWVSIDHVTSHTVTIDNATVEGYTKAVWLINRLPVSEDATKVIFEYVLSTDNLVGHAQSFAAIAFYGAGNWDHASYNQDNAHIPVANNAACYTASYTITFDFATGRVTWHRGTTLILERTESTYDFADLETFGIRFGTDISNEVFTARMYDDTGKDLGITAHKAASNITVEYPKATFVLNNGQEDVVVDVTGATVAKIEDPVKENNYLFGWYADELCTIPYDFTKEVVSDVTIYAKWVEAKAYYMYTDESATDGFTWHTKEAPAESATKVYIKFNVIDKANAGRHHQLFASGERSTLSGGQTFSNSWFPIGGTVTYVVDLASKNIELLGVDGEGLMNFTYTDDATQFGATIYHGYSGGYLYVKGLYKVHAFDDTGKDLGITTPESTGVYVTADDLAKVTIDEGNGNVSYAYTPIGATIAKPSIVFEGHLLKGWFADSEFTTPFDFTTAITEDTTIYAQWVSIDSVISRQVTIDDATVEGYTKAVWLINRLPVSEDATKVIFEYVLSTDNLVGHAQSFAAMVFYGEGSWDQVGYNQDNAHVIAANNAACYTAPYTITFDFATGRVTWYRGTTLILERTESTYNFAELKTFGIRFGTNISGEVFTARMYDDTGKDLGITAHKETSHITIEYPKANFVVNQDTTISVDVVGATPVVPEIPAVSGYRLVGWYADSELTTEYDFTKEVVDDVNIYAKLEVIPTATINFVVNGGSAIDSITVNQGEAFAAPTAPTRDLYDFAGWYTDEALTTAYDFSAIVEGDSLTLYAKWTLVKHQVTFETNGGVGVEPLFVEHGSVATAPTAPTKAGYDFVGWFADSALTTAYDFTAEVTAPITIYAKWELTDYTVTFNTNGGSAIDPVTVSHGGELTAIDTPVKAGYAFIGWFLDEACTRALNLPLTIEEDITIYAKWEIVVYTITFDVDGGSEVSSITVNAGTAVEKPADPTKAGFTFGGWYTDINCEVEYDFATLVDGDITLYAKWNKVEQAKSNCKSMVASDIAVIGLVIVALAGVVVIKNVKTKKED